MMNAAFVFASADTALVHLRVLATSDLHMHLMPFDYARNRPSARVGLARTAGLIAAARSEARNVLLFDNGDFLQGNPMADLAAAADGPSPMIQAMNALRFDAATLGNHEFDYGLPVLLRALEDAAFPVVSANTLLAPGREPLLDRTLLPPWTIIERQVADLAGRPLTLRVGVIGVLPPQVAVWDRDHVEGRLWFRDMVDAAAARVPELRAAGADIVVALAHTGIGPAAAVAGMENAALPLARIPGIDVLVTGHAHLVFPSPRFAGLPGVDAEAGLIEGKPAVMPGQFGSHLGVVDVLLQPGGAGWRVAASGVVARPVLRERGDGRRAAATPAVASVVQAAETAHRSARAWTDRKLGRSGSRLCSHFALVSDTAAFRLVAMAKVEAVRSRLRGTEWDGLPVIASATPFRTGGRAGPGGFVDIPAGTVLARHVADLYPFPNLLCILLLTGAGVRQWLERGATMFRTIAEADRDVPLFDAEVPGYNLDLLAELDFDIRLDRPPGDRIRGLLHAGRAVAENDLFIVATSSYRAATSAPGAPVVLADERTVPRLIEAYVSAGGARRIERGGGWRLCLPPGASATFDTAPGARVDEFRADGLSATDLGLTAGGFRSVRLAAVQG